MFSGKVYLRAISTVFTVFLSIGLCSKPECESQMNEVGLSVKEIVDALNFARRVIKDGEITYVSSSTIDLTNSKKDVNRKIKELSQRLKESKSGQEKKRIRDDIQLHKDWLELLPEWPTHNECYIAFQVPGGGTDNELQSACYKRVHLTDKRSLKRRPFFIESLYHKTVIVSGEHMASLIVSVPDPWETNVIGNNDGFVEKSHPVIEFSFYLLGRASFKIDVNQVKKVYKENSGLLVMELDLGEIKVSGGYKPHRVVKLWINPQEGFSVVREERYEIAGKLSVLSDTRSYGRFKEYPGGIWYPTYFEYVRYTPVTKKVKMRFTVVIKEADFNIGVPERFFDFTLEEMKQVDILLSSWYGKGVFTDFQSRLPRLIR